MRRTTCSGCGYDDLRTFLDLGVSPIADAYTDTPFAPVEAHPLQLAVCTGCWLVQLLEVVDHKTLFGTGYSFYSSASAPLSAYHEGYAHDIFASHLTDNSLVVEIGCNDGDMLRHFATGRVRTVGVDPAGGPVSVARERGLTVIEKPFDGAVAQEIIEQHGPATIVIANHVLAHVENVSETLAGISRLMTAESVAFVEVQYLPDLLVSNAFDLVYHEHRNFFSLASLEHAAERWGLYVVDAVLTDRQGGSLRVTLSRRRQAASTAVQLIHASERWLTNEGAYTGFQGRVERVRDRLRELLQTESAKDRILVGYGAPAKATTLLNYCGIGHDLIEYVTDTTPAKQGRYIPGTGIPITGPSNLPAADTVLVLAWNYLPQIMRNHAEFTAGGGRWIAPIPVPTLI